MGNNLAFVHRSPWSTVVWYGMVPYDIVITLGTILLSWLVVTTDENLLCEFGVVL